MRADERDARDAVSVLNRHTFEGCELRVEFVSGDIRRDSGGASRSFDFAYLVIIFETVC